MSGKSGISPERAKEIGEAVERAGGIGKLFETPKKDQPAPLLPSGKRFDKLRQGT